MPEPGPEELLAWHAGLVALDRRGPSVAAVTGLEGESGGLEAAVDEVVGAVEAFGAGLGGRDQVARRTAFAVSEISAQLRHFAGLALPDEARSALHGAWRVDRAWNTALAN